MKTFYLRELVTATLMLCASWAIAGDKFDDVVKIGPDTCSISRTDHGGIFRNAGKMKTKV